MDRVAESELLDFCAKQKSGFSAQRWHEFGAVKSDDLAAAALFLAGVDWYGHREELLGVAERLRPGYVGKFSQLVKKTAMDCSRFSNMLKVRLAR